MPYPSLELLAAAATDLSGRHPLTIVSIPALLRAAHETGTPPTQLQDFGSKQERAVLDAFKVDDGPKPYLAVWSTPPQRVNHDYPGSTLQRLRTLDPLGRSILHDDYNPPTQRKRRQFALRANAGSTLAATQPKVSKVSLAAWLGRDRQFDDIEQLIAWFDKAYPLTGTDLDGFYLVDIPTSIAEITLPLVDEPTQNQAILDYLNVDPPNPLQELPVPTTILSQPARPEEEGLSWTREVCEYPLPNPDPQAITATVLADLATHHIELPDADQLVRRCVTALLVGHLILTGPPGTGKTTLARALSRGFHSQLIEATATSEWSPYHVVGGFRPNASGGLSPAYGKVAEAALLCAELVRASANAEAEDTEDNSDQGGDHQSEGPTSLRCQAAWLFIDEFNRADIDKAIGSLYTLLSSCDPEHLRDSPVDLWFETRVDCRNLWVPARFRIIGAMNDLDTSFVNTISQGLTRRFQFVTVGVPATVATPDQKVTSELENAFAGAHDWLDRTYGSSIAVQPVEQARASLGNQLENLQQIMDGLRHPDGQPGWPIGTAQVVNVLRVLLLTVSADPSEDHDRALDVAVADLLVPQMSNIDDQQFDAFSTLFGRLRLSAAQAALTHVFDPHGIL